MKPITVVHLITSLNTGGAEVALLRLLTGTNRQDFETQVICMIPIGPIGERIQALGIPVISLEMPPGHPTLKGFQKLLVLLEQSKPAILQTWLYHADLLGLLAAKLTGIKTVVWNIRSANMDFEQYGRLSGIVFKICAFLSDLPKAVVVNSQAGQTIHTHLGYHPKEWVCIPNGIDPSQFQPNIEERERIRQDWLIQNDELLVGLAGRFDPMKDHPTFLKAAAILQKEHPKAHFVSIGDGPEDYSNKLKVLAKKLNLSNFLWAGPYIDMPSVYNALDILVSSSITEGFPNVVAEAMACGKPCVVTNVGDSAMLIANTGVSVPPGNPEGLAKAIAQVLELSASQREHLGEKARQRIVENFSIDKMVNAYSALYKRLA